jgi:hypothetical protein
MRWKVPKEGWGLECLEMRDFAERVWNEFERVADDVN